jgi:hypothetical protein
MHEGDDLLNAGCLCDADVAVSHESDLVSLPADDAVYDIHAPDVFRKYNSTLSDVCVSPWTKDDLVAHMHDERVHAVAFGAYGHSLSFRNQSADFCHHKTLLFDDCAHTRSKISKIYLYTDKNSYL